MSAWCQVVLAGGRVLPDGDADPDSLLFGLDGLSVEWGRDTALDQPQATTVGLSVVMGPVPWPEWVRSELLAIGAGLDVVTVPYPDAATGAGVVAHARVTDVSLSWDDTAGCAVAVVTAVDHLGQLESEPIGDEPWPVEPIGDRLARLAELTSTGVLFEIPAATAPGDAQATLAGTLVAAADVDATAAAGLIQDLAQAGDAAAWPVYGPAVTTEVPTLAPLVWLRSNVDRLAIQALHIGSDGTVTVGQPADPYADPAADWAPVSACWIPRADAGWGRSASTLVTRAAVGWVDASGVTPDEPDPTTRTVTIVDTGLESAQGVHGVSFETSLTTAAEARILATRLLIRTGLDQWLTTGLRIDQAEIPAVSDPAYGDTTATLARLLASHSRAACPILVAELADWVPLPAEAGGILLAYVEGGSYSFTGGRWLLDLKLSAAGGGTPAAWQDVPPEVPVWAWSNVNPSVRWVDAAVPVEVS